MGEDERPGTRVPATVTVADGRRTTTRLDYLATEEPLEIRVRSRDAGGPARSLAVTMRTPGADFELAAGFLFGEGVITGAGQIRSIRYCADVEREDQRYNVVTVDLTGDAPAERELQPLERHFMTTSACGVCGKASLEALELNGCRPVGPGPQLELSTIYRLPGTLASAQKVFRSTGGLHAAGLFDPSGRLLVLKEDVGRHNALDKLIGWALLAGRAADLRGGIVLVSGRASFELAQKCATAGIPILCAVSAPSSLAVDVARRFGLTLIGFLRGERCNIYTGAERITTIPQHPLSNGDSI